MKKLLVNMTLLFCCLAVAGGVEATRLVAASLSTSISNGLIPEGITDTFVPNSPVIHAVVVFTDSDAGTTARGSWIAVDAIETSNYEIDSAVVKLTQGDTRAHFQLTKPDNGWPEGNYKLNIYLDETFITAVPFTVARSSDQTIFGSSNNSKGLSERSGLSAQSSMVGSWQCQMSMSGLPLGAGLLSFNHNGKATMGDTPFDYQVLQGGLIRLQDQSGYNDYAYKLSGDNLEMSYSDGAKFVCRRTSQAEGTMTRNNMPGGNNNQAGGQSAWQLQGTFCSWSVSSSYYSSSDYSSYSSTQRITFDGRGRWSFGSESSFSSNAGLAYSGGDGGESGLYQVNGNQILYRTNSGEQGIAQVKMQQNNGQITEIMVDGTLYSPALCE